MTRLIKRLSGPKTLLFLGVAYTLFLTLASVSPTSDLPKIDIPWLDKIVHVLLYLILTALWLSFGYVRSSFRFSLKIIVLILIACFGYGIVIEVIQEQFTTFRNADLNDIAANFVGVILGWVVFLKWKYLLNPKT